MSPNDRGYESGEELLARVNAMEARGELPPSSEEPPPEEMDLLVTVPVESILSGEEVRELEAAARRNGHAPRDGFIRLSEVVEREIAWFWPGRLAWANVAVIAGDGGVGKSTLVQELGARVSRGKALPGGVPGEPRGVVILTAEEDAAAVVRPRMRLMGADLERVVVLDPDETGLTLPSGAGRLEARCQAEAAGLVVIDTGPAFLDPALKSNSEEDVRRFLAPLRALAERQRLVVLVLAHLNKATGMAARLRIMGGAAWVNAPRQVLLVGAPPGEDPRETGDRIVAVEKNNLGVYPPAVAFRLAPSPEDGTRAVVLWGGEVAGVRSADLVGEPSGADERSEREEAGAFLKAELADGARPVRELRAAAEVAGIAWRTLERAKRERGVVAERRGGIGAEGGWWWSLPNPATPVAEIESWPHGGDSGKPDAMRLLDPGEPLRPPSSETGGLRIEGDAAGPPDEDLERWRRLAGEAS